MVRVVSVMVEVQVFGHLVLVDHFADFEADLVGAGEAARGDGGQDRCQELFGGGEQFAAFAGAFGGQEWVAAADEPLAGVVGVGDLGEVLIIEQAHLQRPVVGGQGGDGRGAQRGQPAEPAEVFESGDAGGGDHAAVPDHHHVR